MPSAPTSILDKSLSSGKTWDPQRDTVAAPNWVRYQDALARALLLRDWLALRNAFNVSEALQGLAEAMGGGAELTDEQRKAIESVRRNLVVAQDTMSDLTMQLQTLVERCRAVFQRKRVRKG